MEENKSSRFVGLNVGGRVYLTSRSTLTGRPGMLQTMFSGQMPPGDRDRDGNYILDRNERAFSLVLEFLRNGVYPEAVQGLCSQDEVDRELSYFFPEDEGLKAAMEAARENRRPQKRKHVAIDGLKWEDHPLRQKDYYSVLIAVLKHKTLITEDTPNVLISQKYQRAIPVLLRIYAKDLGDDRFPNLLDDIDSWGDKNVKVKAAMRHALAELITEELGIPRGTVSVNSQMDEGERSRCWCVYIRFRIDLLA